VGYESQPIVVRVLQKQTVGVEFSLRQGTCCTIPLSRIRCGDGRGYRMNDASILIQGAPVADPLAGRGVRLLPGDPDDETSVGAADCCIVTEQASHPTQGTLELELLLDAQATGLGLLERVRASCPPLR